MIEEMSSVFPTTSSTCWLSSLTGLSVDRHGVPGVVFRTGDDGGDPINVFTHSGELGDAVTGNVFSDAARLGYLPVSLAGDLEDYDGAWREMLLRHSRRTRGPRVYTPTHAAEPLASPGALCERIRRSIVGLLDSDGRTSSLFVWCFADVDRHVHRHGYDDHVAEFLRGIERLAIDLVAQGCLVIAHSDHGLTPTDHDPALEAALDGLTRRHGWAIGGAGRCRWLYAAADGLETVRDQLAPHGSSDLVVVGADEVFEAASLARRRVGAVVVVAVGRRFVTSPGYTHDHGSLTPVEVAVPFAHWSG